MGKSALCQPYNRAHDECTGELWTGTDEHVACDCSCHGRYVAAPHAVCPVCLLISCDCSADEVAGFLLEQSEMA